MGEQEGVNPTDDVANDETVLRLTWWPQDFDTVTGDLLPVAFRREDLSGPGHGVSVDRKHLARREVVAKVAEEQKPKKPEDRVDPYLAASAVRLIRSAAGVDGPGIFLVAAEPIKDVNPAHAHISSRRSRTKSEMNEARLELLSQFQKPVAFDKHFAPAAA